MRALFILLPFIFISLTSLAQQRSFNHNAWLHYVGNFSFSPKSAITMEATYRMANFTQDFQQFFIRPSYDYKLKDNLTASLGYTYVLTGIYGSPAMNKTNMPENHLWIQGQIQNKIGAVAISNRLRNENRFVGIASPVNNDLKVDDYAYRNRMRYMLIASLPIITFNNQSISGFIGNEFFFNIGKNAGKTFMNQNRVIAGFGYRLNKSNQIQLAYLQQSIRNYPNSIREENSTLRLSYISGLKLYKDAKPTLNSTE